MSRIFSYVPLKLDLIHSHLAYRVFLLYEALPLLFPLELFLDPLGAGLTNLDQSIYQLSSTLIFHLVYRNVNADPSDPALACSSNMSEHNLSGS